MGKGLLSKHTALFIKCSVKATTDTNVNPSKVYYEAVSGQSGYYKVAENPTSVSSLYEIVADGTTSATEAMVQPCCIKDIPDMGGDPETVETTDLCDDAQTYIEGLQGSETMAFTANYNAFVLYAINTILKGKSRKCEIVFGDMAGVDGKFGFDAMVSARVNGFGVNEVREMTINAVPTSSIEQANPND